MTITKATDLVAEARAGVENLTAQQVWDELGGDGVLLVDLREASELASEGLIPGALHVPRGLLEFCADPSFPKYEREFRAERRTILYCATGGRSALAARTLSAMGYGDVAHLDGGLVAWTAAGLPVTGTAA